MLQKMTAWRRNVHAANPNLASLPANVKGTIIHSSVAKRMRGLNVGGLRVNQRLDSPFYAPGTSQHLSPATGLPYAYRIPDFRLQGTILDIKPRGTPLTGAQVDDFMSCWKHIRCAFHLLRFFLGASNVDPSRNVEDARWAKGSK